MPEMFVSPDEISIPVVGKVNLLEAMTDAGVDVAHLCGARARCSTCRVRIVEGLNALTARTDDEAAMATRLSFPDEVRLACQAEVEGSVRLWRLVLDRIDVEMASQLGKGHYRGSVGREIEEAAVMFTDVVGFTTLSESLPPYDVVHIINRFFSRVEAAVEAQRGRVDNYMGDGLLAVFGVNNEADPALAAVRAGLEALDVAADMDQYVGRIYGHAFRVRVGIDLGEVIFGLMGGEMSARETVIGDVVNTASRLESANKTTGTSILVTDAVRERTITSVEYGRRFDLDLRGKDGRIVAYEAVALMD
jgi:class 3 adenylate cyclase